MTKGANGFTGWHYECGSHGKSRGEKCKRYSEANKQFKLKQQPKE